MTMVDLRQRFEAASQIAAPDLQAAIDAKLASDPATLRVLPGGMDRRGPSSRARLLTVAAALLIAAIAIGFAVRAFRFEPTPAVRPLPRLRHGGEILQVRYRGGVPTAESGANLGLFAVDPATGDSRRLLEPPSFGATVIGGAWSPDGTRLLYEVERGEAGDAGFWVRDANGTRRIGVPSWSMQRWWSFGGMAWSHDGTRIVIYAPAGDPGRESPGAVWIADLAAPTSGRTIDATRVPGTSSRGLWSGPAWSSDDTMLTYGTGDATSSQIHVISLDGASHFTTEGTDSSWQPGGDLIAYSTNEGVVVSPPDLSSSTIVGDGGGLFAWSPDGSKIAFVGGRDLWVVGSDGVEPTRLLHLDMLEVTDTLVWSPDGSWVAFRQGTYDSPTWRLAAADGSDLDTPPRRLPTVSPLIVESWTEG